ncbi:MAG: TlpA family protein disulfide reductase [Burkholderiales bacterium]|nr:TlpA family protein disulfide reductase [Burkholderiales bacterium]
MRVIALVLALWLPAPVMSAQAPGGLQPWGGGPVPPLRLKDLDGRLHRLADYRGRVVLLNFWATWCGPCREEMPSITRLRKKLAGRPFAVLAVNLDEPESRVRKFLAEVPLDFPVLMDPGARATKEWKVRILPASFLIARDGGIRYTVTGEIDWSNEHVVALVSELLSGRAPATARAGPAR